MFFFKQRTIKQQKGCKMVGWFGFLNLSDELINSTEIVEIWRF